MANFTKPGVRFKNGQNGAKANYIIDIQLPLDVFLHGATAGGYDIRNTKGERHSMFRLLARIDDVRNNTKELRTKGNKYMYCTCYTYARQAR